MPTYTVTAHHVCMRCGATAKWEEPATPIADGDYRVHTLRFAPGWRDVTIPRPSGPVVQGELCPDCVTAVAAFILPSKES